MYPGGKHQEDCPESLRNKYPNPSREDLLKEILTDPGNTLFGKPLSEIQAMISREEARGNNTYDILFRALQLCNESRSRLTCFGVKEQFWLDEAIFEKDKK
jgi:hypothetical protein